MKLIKTEEAVGHILCQDMTQIIAGKSKGPRFKKGHVVTEKDVPVLLSMGKVNLYVWEMEPGMVHENDAAHRLADVLIPRPQTSCPSSCGYHTSDGSGQGCPAGCSGRCRYVPA